MFSSKPPMLKTPVLVLMGDDFELVAGAGVNRVYTGGRIRPRSDDFLRQGRTGANAAE